MVDQVNYRVVEGWEQLPKGYAHRDVAGVAVDRRTACTSSAAATIPSSSTTGRAISCARGARATSPSHARHLRRAERHDLRHRRRQPHGAPVHARGQAADDDGHSEQPSDTGYDGKTTGSIKRAAAAVQPPDQRRDRPQGRHLHLGRLRQRARAHVLAHRAAEALVGRARRRPRPVPPAARHRGAPPTGASSCATAKRPHPDLQPRRRVPEQWTDTQRPTHITFDRRATSM